jgi:hypothetical protein
MEISFESGSGKGTTFTVDQLMEEIEKDVVFFDESGGGVTFSGGEPLMQPDFLDELLEVTPASYRIRKRILNTEERGKQSKKAREAKKKQTIIELKEIKLSAALLDPLTGKYDYGQGKAILTVTREDEHLLPNSPASPRSRSSPAPRPSSSGR